MNKAPLMGKIAMFAATCLICSFCAYAQSVHQWGWAEAQPLPADYDGDGAADLAVYDPSSGCWYVFSPAQNSILAWGFQWGMADAVPKTGDYDGDGAADLAVYHTPTARWFIYSLAREVILAWGEEWGCAGVEATPADYDGDGRTDLAVYHTPTGKWHILFNTPPEINDAETLWNMYLNAVLYAARPRSQTDVYTRLTAVTPNNPLLHWRQHPVSGILQVKAAAFLPAQTATNLYCPGFTTILPTDVELHVTMVPELREFMGRYRGLNKTLRAKQILGLPPDDASDTVVEFWVARLFSCAPARTLKSRTLQANRTFPMPTRGISA